MSNPGEDLNRLDLGLPEFQAAPSAPIGSAGDKGDSVGGTTGDGAAVGREASKPDHPNERVAKRPVSATPATQGATASSSASGSTKPTGSSSAASSEAPNPTIAKATGAKATGANLSKPAGGAAGVPSGRGGSAAATDSQAAANAAESSPHFETARNRSWWNAAPSWAISTVIHVAAILVLAAWNIEPIQKELSLMLTVGEPAGDEANALEEFSIDNSMAELQSDTSEEAPSDAPAVETAMVEAKVEVDLSGVLAVSPAATIPSVSQSLAPSSGIAAQSSSAMRAALNSRSKETKREMLKKYGGTTETERAVAMALAWLAAHQNRETGAWTFTHPLICGGQCDRPGDRTASMNAATGLALMCFLGAGQTHLEGDYKETVMGGLRFLIQNMRVQQVYGAWYRGDGHSGGGQDDMYAHGIASIAMCEAYGMTRDQSLLEAAQLSINYMTYAQNPQTGGWHYSPFPLGKLPGDTSVVGWQMMAIKSGAMAGLNFDLDSVRRANGFLDSMLVPGGFGYHYSLESKLRNPTEYRPAMTACGVLCRMYSGWNKEEPTIKAAVARFAADGPSKNDNYYNYYATQVMKQFGGSEWEAWNTKMRDQIVSTQVQTGHAAGSWFTDEPLGATQGGRLYCTCMATMMLEVYYRYMPLYAEQAEEDAFQL